MYSGELEVQAKRKAIAVLQDEINRILNASRELATLPELMMKKDKTGIKNTLEQISTIEEEVENLRRKITREVADVGGAGKFQKTVFDSISIFDDEEELPLPTQQVALAKVIAPLRLLIQFSYSLKKFPRREKLCPRAGSRRRSTVIHFKQKFRSFKGTKSQRRR